MFHVGQKVVCVDDADIGRYFGEKIPARGVFYTIRSIYDTPQGNGLLLNEIRNRPRNYDDGYHECGWFAWRFRPLIERKQSTSTGFEILDDIRKRETFDEPVKKPVRAD